LSVNFLPACVASHSDALVKVFLFLGQLISVFFEHHLQKFDSSAFEGKDEHHVADFLLFEVIGVGFEDVDQFNHFGTHEFQFTATVLLCQAVVVFAQQL